MSETHLSELAGGARGPKATGNALKFRNVGLRNEFWDWVLLFATDEEKAQIAEDIEDKKQGNFTPALQRAVEAARRFMPCGERGMLRNAKGHWVSPTPGTGKKALAKRLKREQQKEGNQQ